VAVECLGLELTSRCDLACAHCLRAIVPPNSPRARDIPFDVAVRMVDEARAAGINHVGMTGGEPMIYPRFMELIDHIVDRGMTYHFLSNALGLPAFMPQFLARPERRIQLRDVCVSIDGATEATHDAIRGKGMFKRALAGLAVLKANGVPFTLLHTITRKSRHELDQLGMFAHHIGATRLFLSHFLPNGRHDATKDLDLDTRERHDVEFVVKRLIDAMRFPIAMAEGYYTPVVDHVCATVAGRSLNIDPNAHLTFCCELSNFNGDDRPPEERPDFICDMRTTSVARAIELQAQAVAEFRARRLAAQGAQTEDDRFACRYCVKHFGKPEKPVQLRLRRASAKSTPAA
jgi:MoaA/NifB/PqqE/SkfB family radical SAM enzyme